MVLKKIVKNQIQELVETSETNTQEEFLTREETANLLKIDKSTLWLWTKKGKLISYGIGNRVYYKRHEVEEAVIRLN